MMIDTTELYILLLVYTFIEAHTNARKVKKLCANYLPKFQMDSIIMIMSAFLERLSMWNMLNGVEQVQIQNTCI